MQQQQQRPSALQQQLQQQQLHKQEQQLQQQPLTTQPMTSLTSSATTLIDLRTLLNTCKTPSYAKISELRTDVGYLIIAFERVATRYGDAITAVLEGLVGDDFSMRIYLPRRYTMVLNDDTMEAYNNGVGDRIFLVRRSAPAGSNITPLEFA